MRDKEFDEIVKRATIDLTTTRGARPQQLEDRLYLIGLVHKLGEEPVNVKKGLTTKAPAKSRAKGGTFRGAPPEDQRGAQVAEKLLER